MACSTRHCGATMVTFLSEDAKVYKKRNDPNLPPSSRDKFQLILVLLFQPTGQIAFTLFIMPREFHKMPALPDTIDDLKVQELMSHYFATSNHGSDHEGFADMFTTDGEYWMNDRKAKGRQGSKIPTLFAHPI